MFMQKIITLFPAFKSKNYRLYFVGQLVSLIGTWLQIVAESWLVLTLTNSAFLIGLVAACATLPTLIFSLFGGVIVDRFSKKRILIITQFASMILAGIYGVMTIMHVINIWEIMILAFLLGVVNALDFPARQAFTVELVEREHLSSAIAMNAGMFNGARIIGPGVAGILIALFGPGGAFLINSATYIAGIISINSVHTMEAQNKKDVHAHPIQAVKDGLSYAFSHPTIKSLIILTAIISIFGWSYQTVMPLIAKNTMHVGAAGLGYLYAVVGLGALLSTFIVTVYVKKVGNMPFIVGGTILFALSIFGFSYTKSVLTAIPFLFLSGIGLLSSFAVINTTLQHTVEDKFRGRVLSIYILAFVGLFPLGNFEVGWVSEHLGPQNAIRIGSVIVIVSSILYYLSRNKRGAKQEVYDVQKENEEKSPEGVLSQGEW